MILKRIAGRIKALVCGFPDDRERRVKEAQGEYDEAQYKVHSHLDRFFDEITSKKNHV